ncbi:MAG: molybdopterin-dependent oxidoreductase [Planctomycetota bacterium]
MSDERLNRRDLLRAALISGAAASVGCNSAQPTPEPLAHESVAGPRPSPAPGERLSFREASATQAIERRVQSACQFCNCLCGLQVGVARDQVQRIEPLAPDADPVQRGQLCVKADLMAELVASGRRIRTPLLRAAGAKGDPSSRFEAVDWDTALERIAARWLELAQAGEARAIANRTTGRMLRGAGELIGRILQVLGSPNAHDVGPVCNDAGGDALRATFGLGAFTNGYGVDPLTGEEDLGQANYVLLLGTNQAETHPVTFDYVLRQARARGATLVAVDPRVTPTGALADRALLIRPGTDLAFALGLLSHVIEAELYDRAFVREHVLGFEALVTHLRERGYTPAWAAERTGIPAATLVEVAEGYARARPGAIYANAGISHQVNAFATYRALAALAAITGNVGRPGGGCNFMHNTWPGGLGLPPLEGPLPSPGPALPQGPDHFASAILDGEPYRLRAVMTQGNPLASSAGSARVREAFRALEHYVYTGLFMEESALYADVILPVASGLEFEGVYMRRDDRGIRWQAQAVPRVGEARTDVEVFVGLAQALARLDPDRAETWRAAARPEWADYGALWDAFVAHTPGAGGMTRARLRERTRPLRWPCPSTDHPGTSTLYLDHPGWYAAAEALGAPPGRRFLTPSGKVELTTPPLEAQLAALGHSALPVYFTHPETTGVHPRLATRPPLVDNPFEPGSLAPQASISEPCEPASRDAFPLVGAIGRSSVVHFAGVTHWTPTGKRLDGERVIQAHPRALARFGVADGGPGWVESPRGRVLGRAQATEGIREDTVFVPNGFGPSQTLAADVGRPRYAEVANALVDPRTFDTVSGQQAYKCFACRLSPGQDGGSTPGAPAAAGPR